MCVHLYFTSVLQHPRGHLMAFVGEHLQRPHMWCQMGLILSSGPNLGLMNQNGSQIGSKFDVGVILQDLLCFFIPGPLNPKPQTPDPKLVFWSVLNVSEQFVVVDGISFEITYINQTWIVRMLDSGVSSCSVWSKVLFQHFHPPPDPYTKVKFGWASEAYPRWVPFGMFLVLLI